MFMWFKVKKHFIFHILYIIVAPFWNALIFTKLIALRSEACSNDQLSSALWLAEYLKRDYCIVMPCPGATTQKQ